jgi:c-di-GMP-binding flagellar brake protein YcgR
MVNRAPAKKPDADCDYTQQHETITSPLRISTLLRNAMERHVIITATLPGSKHFFNTAFLSTDHEKGILVIDELHPKVGHGLFIETGTIALHIMLDGIEINFTAALTKAGSAKNIAYYELGFPDNIRYLQRRNSFRVPVSAANKIDVEIYTVEKKMFSGELSDVSAEGMRVRFSNKKNADLEDITEELQCLIKLPDKRQINCAFNICHSITDKESNSLYIGGHFERIDKIQRRSIERFVNELQRLNRKKLTD